MKDLTIPNPWACIQCGMCCKRYNPTTKSIDRCQYLQADDQCGIYEDRPIACRLDHMSDDLKTTHCNISIMSIQNKITQEALIDLIRNNSKELQGLTKQSNSEQGEFVFVSGT